MSSKTVLETLEAARSLITPEGAWTQGWFARDSSGNQIEPESRGAVCWCSWGALIAVADNSRSNAALKSLRREAGRSVTSFNDEPGRTHAEVLRAFDAAIAKEREAQHA